MIPKFSREPPDLAGGEQKGLAFGWYNFAAGGATLPASLLFGLLDEQFGPGAAFGWGAGLALLAVLLLLGVRQRADTTAPPTCVPGAT